MVLASLELTVFVAHTLVGVLAFRTLPFAAWVATSHQLKISGRFAVLVGYALLAAAACAVPSGFSPWLLAAYAYYVLMSVGVYFGERWARGHTVAPGAIFVFAALGFLILPAVIGVRMTTAMLLLPGWDLMLSGYSYCMEARKSRNEPSLRDCLFFLLVNPVLVYADRGHEVEASVPKHLGLKRAALGTLALGSSVALLQPDVLAWARASSPISEAPLLAYCLARALGEYAAQSGVASLQIGLMRQLGYVIPERYVYPFLARSPLDFWRRWNTYVGSWIQRYVFTPIAVSRPSRRFLPAVSQSRRAPLDKGVALLAAFLAVGALHDAFTYGLTLERSTLWTERFAYLGASTLLWYAVETAVAALAAGRGRQPTATVKQAVSRAVLVCAVLGVTALQR